MAELGRIIGLDRPLTRDELCQRLGCSRSALDKWLLPPGNGREMPPVLWQHIREVIENEALKALMRKRGESAFGPLGVGPLYERLNHGDEEAGGSLYAHNRTHRP